MPQNEKYIYDAIQLNNEDSKLVFKIITKELTKSNFILRNKVLVSSL